jgi:hypothetical protein
MRELSIFLAMLVAGASSALAGITVTSYSTLAGANAWAPVGGTQYIDQETAENVSPATVSAAGDWTGTNTAGTTPTWHFVGSAQAASTPVFDANLLTVTGAGSFAYQIDTTADFIDPRSSSIFSPGAGVNYNGFFTTDAPVTYAMTGQLNENGRVQLNSIGGGVGVVFNQSNPTPNPAVLNLTGTLPLGQYRVLIAAGLGASNLPNGVNNYARSGSFEDRVFTVQVPEPGISAIGMTTILIATTRRNRCACAR